MALYEADLIAAGYHKNDAGNWQRGSITADDSTLTVDGAFLLLKSGTQASLVTSMIDDWRASRAFPTPQTPQEIRGFHEQELSAQMGEALRSEQVVLEKLMSAQNNRSQMEKAFYSVNTRIPINYAQAQLNLQQAMLDEMKENVNALKARYDVVDIDKVYHNANIWWPESVDDLNQWQPYIDEKQKQLDEIQKQINSYQFLIHKLTQNIVQTNKDIQSINNGLVPDKYKYDNETQLTLNALNTVSVFYKNVTQQFGIIAGNNVTTFAYLAKGQRIRNSQQAIAAWSKYQDKIYTKFKSADIKAIENSLKSINSAELAKKLLAFQRGLGVVSNIINPYLLVNEIQISVKTRNWNNTLLKIETMFAGILATELLAGEC